MAGLFNLKFGRGNSGRPIPSDSRCSLHERIVAFAERTTSRGHSSFTRRCILDSHCTASGRRNSSRMLRNQSDERRIGDGSRLLSRGCEFCKRHWQRIRSPDGGWASKFGTRYSERENKGVADDRARSFATGVFAEREICKPRGEVGMLHKSHLWRRNRFAKWEGTKAESGKPKVEKLAMSAPSGNEKSATPLGTNGPNCANKRRKRRYRCKQQQGETPKWLGRQELASCEGGIVQE